jgi:hypothetical protein
LLILVPIILNGWLSIWINSKWLKDNLYFYLKLWLLLNNAQDKFILKIKLKLFKILVSGHLLMFHSIPLLDLELDLLLWKLNMKEMFSVSLKTQELFYSKLNKLLSTIWKIWNLSCNQTITDTDRLSMNMTLLTLPLILLQMLLPLDLIFQDLKSIKILEQLILK